MPLLLLPGLLVSGALLGGGLFYTRDRPPPPSPSPSICESTDSEDLRERWRLTPGVFSRGDDGLVCLPDRTGSNKFNAMFEGHGPVLDHARMVVRIEEGEETVWVGWCPERKFGEGWRLRGFMFGGNLSDGGGSLRADFGPRVVPGDVVETTARFEGKKLVIDFAVNGENLGDAFVLDDLPVAPKELNLFPCVSFLAEGKVTLLPSNYQFVSGSSRKLDSLSKYFLGKWECRIEGSPIVATLTIVPVRREQNSFVLSLKIVNVLRMVVVLRSDLIHPVLKSAETSSSNTISFEFENACPVSTTLMAVDFAASEIEKRFTYLLSCVRRMSLQGSTKLILCSGGVATLSGSNRSLKLDDGSDDAIEETVFSKMILSDDRRPVGKEEVERVFG